MNLTSFTVNADGTTQFYVGGTPYSTIQFEFSAGASLELAYAGSNGGGVFVTLGSGITASTLEGIPFNIPFEVLSVTVSNYVSGTCTVSYRPASIERA